MKIKILVVLFVSYALFPLYGRESKEISSIREYYNQTLKKIKTESIQRREMYFTYPVTPGIGVTASKVFIYYEMTSGSDGDYDYSIVRVENYFQHTAKIFYEEYVYSADGSLLFYYGRRGMGDINRVAAIEWKNDERFYYWNNKLVRVMYDAEVIDQPLAEDIKKSAVRLQHAKDIRIKNCNASFPQPVMFTAE